jgi:Sec-independent protein translocase protein TatA
MTELLAAGDISGISPLGLLVTMAPLILAIVAVAKLGPDRQKTVGEALGDAVEDLRAELTEVRKDRDQLRAELADALARIRDLEAKLV